MAQTQITDDVIASFLAGKDPQKYITSIEVPYHIPEADLIINDPKLGKYIETKKFKPFLWMKADVSNIVYEGSRKKIKAAAKKYGVKFQKLTTQREDGFEPERLRDGYKFLAITDKNYSSLIQFFKDGGLDIYSEQHRHLFMAITPVEQFMIQTGKRLFKGFEDYDNIHRFQFDLETTGLYPETSSIFQIGMRDNRGFEEIIEITGDTDSERRESERQAMKDFFKVIDYLKPDVITGYNSENFDWNFFVVRCEILGLNIKNIVRVLDPEKGTFRRKESRIKLGGMTENYSQAIMWGYSILDIWHAVRKAKAINSEIKLTSLKYITKFSKIAKLNRVYVPGDMLNKTWADTTNHFYFDDTNGDWFKHEPNTELLTWQEDKLKGGNYEIVSGAFIVRRYLLDDLWETEKVDSIYNQATFLISKILPTTFMKAATMGTAGTWKLIMMSWSYENGLALPALTPKRDFTGGLSRLVEVGFAKRVAKLDYAALYPNIELTHNIFPDLDITGVMKGLLFYIVNQRDVYKSLKNSHGDEYNKVKSLISAEGETPELKDKLDEHDYLKSKYDKEQLPLKILANSFFGSFGAPYLFNWGDSNCAEETTCRGRQYLRLMVKHFHEKYGFRPLVGDSVTFDTPIFIRDKGIGDIDIKPICDIFNPNSEVFDEEQLRDLEDKPYEVLTVNGWRDIQYVYRHETQKQIHRITTKDRLVSVTEDHSLFQNGVQVKPSELERGDAIDVYEVPQQHLDEPTNKDMYWLLGYFLGDGSAIYGERKQYYKSRKTGETHVNKGVRAEWKISSNNLENLERLKSIIEATYTGVTSTIKNHRKSSSVYNLVVYKTDFCQGFTFDFYTSYREKKIPSFVFNTSLDNKRAFMDGVCASDGYGNCMDTVSDIGMKSQVAMAGIGYLLKCLGVDYKIRTRKDKENFISFRLRNGNRGNSEFTDKTKMKSGEVWRNEPIQNKDKNKYVYDISTEDGTFIGGIGAVNLKNTDGFNFAIPDTVDEITYEIKGTHRMTEDKKGQTVRGIDAVVSDFNEEYMIGRMGLDIDDICESTINFSRKNYGNKIDGKVKLVGNTIKSSKLPGYIEDFLNEGIKLLLDDKGKEFVELYYNAVNDIFNYKIPLRKIASKAKVNTTIEAYDKYCLQRNKAGNLNSRKAYMELIKKHDLKTNLGDIIYYVNTGTTKSQGDLKVVKNKEGVVEDVVLQCKLIPSEQLELNPNLTTDEYNVPKYLAALNKRIKPLLVCFDDEVRNNLVLDTKKIKKTNELELKDRQFFTNAQCKLISGKPFNDVDQDSYEELMLMEDKEIKFWSSVNKIPNNMEEEEWDVIRTDYLARLDQEVIDDINKEKEKIKSVLESLSGKDLDKITDKGIMPPEILLYCGLSKITDENGDMLEIALESHKHKVTLLLFSDIVQYKITANLRETFYKTLNSNMDEESKVAAWVGHLDELDFKFGGNYLETLINQEKEKLGIKAIPVKPIDTETINEIEDTSPKEDSEEQYSVIDDDEWNF